MSNETIVRLSVDASGVQAGVERARASNAAYTASVEQMAQRTLAAQNAIDEAVANGSNASARSIQQFVTALGRQADAAGKTRSELLSLKAAQLGITDSVQPYIDKIRVAEEAMNSTGHAAEGLSFKTAQAKRELLVLGHELATGNYKRFSTSLLVLGERTGAASLLFSAAGLTALGLAAAIAGVAFAAYKGAQEQEAFNKQIALTGNFAGITEGQYDNMAIAIANSSHVGIGTAKTTMEGLIATGRFAGETFNIVAATAVDFGRATGDSADKVIKDFVKMSDGVAKWAAEQNQQYHFLSAAQYDHIAQMEEEGKTSEAMQATMEALDAHLKSNVQNLHGLAKVWQIVGDYASGYWEILKSIDKDDTLDQKTTKAAQNALALQDRLAQSDPRNFMYGTLKKQAQQAMDAYQALNKDRSAQEAADRAESEYNQRQAAGIKALEMDKKLKDSLMSRADIEKKQVQEYLDNQKKIQAAGNLTVDSAQKQAQVIKEIHDKFNPDKKEHKAPDTSRQDAGAQLSQDIDKYRKDGEQLAAIFANAQKVLKAQRAAGLVDETQYYATEKALEADAEQAKEDELTKEIDRLQQEHFAGRNAVADKLKNTKAIQDAEAKLAKARDQYATDQYLASLKEKADANKIEQAYRNAADAQQKYLDGIQRTQARTLAGYGQGNQENSRTAGRAQIEDKYDQARRDLEKSRRDAEFNGTFGADAQKKYSDELALIQNFQQKALASYDAYYTDLQHKQGNWVLGVNAALQNYLDDSKNVYAQAGTVVSNAFKGMEDALVTFVTTGKLSFKSLADSIVADITRIVVKEQLSKAIGSLTSGGGVGGLVSSALGFFGGAGGIGGAGAGLGSATAADVAAAGDGLMFFANGGTPPLNVPSVVGENGPELFVPTQAGTIIPNGSFSGNGAGSAPIVVHNHFTVQGATDRRTQAQIAAAAGQGVNRAMARNT